MDLISSHGQTLAHWVDATSTTALGTLQLGAPAWIARTTATPVISDFRSSDIAHGGHGAPLASTLDRLWLGERPTAAIKDRKSTRLNSSHVAISYAVFCLKKKKNAKRLGICAKRETKSGAYRVGTRE